MKAVLLALSFVYSLNTYAVGGGTVGNGGDAYAIAFVSTAEEVLKLLAYNRKPFGFTTSNLSKIIHESKVESTQNQLVLNGVIKDAINYPNERKIVLNRAAWDRLKTFSARYTLVLHEYLGLLGIDDSKYEISIAALKEQMPGIVNCTSILANAGQGVTSGHITLELNSSKEVRGEWSDGIFNYQVFFNGFKIALYVQNRRKQELAAIKSTLSTGKFYFDYSFAIPREELPIRRGGFDITMSEVECK